MIILYYIKYFCLLQSLYFAMMYSLPFLLAERVHLPCSYSLFLKISELSQKKLFFDTALAVLEEVLLLMMSMHIFRMLSPCSSASKTQ